MEKSEFGDMWWDSHCHFADKRLDGVRQEWIFEAQKQSIGFFLQGGIGPEDWLEQKKLKSQWPAQIGLCFGLHPYWIASHNEIEINQALDQLAIEIHEALILGETGLDFRPHLIKDNARELQISAFESQLELASAAEKAVVLHLVQAHEEALQIIDLWGLPRQKGFVHSFNGSVQKMQDLLQRGLLISVGGPLLRPENTKLHQAVMECPLEMLLIETDAPDQPGPNWKNQLNPLHSLISVAEAVAKIKKISYRDVLDESRKNLKRLIEL